MKPYTERYLILFAIVGAILLFRFLASQVSTFPEACLSSELSLPEDTTASASQATKPLVLNQIHDFPSNDADLSDIEFSHDSELLAYTNGNKIEVYHTGTGELFREIAITQPPNTLIGHLSFHPESRVIAYSDDRPDNVWNVVYVWNMVTDERLGVDTFRGVNDIGFTPDGVYLVTATSYNEAIQLWETDTYTPVDSLSANSRFVYSVEFTPDRNCMFSLESSSSGSADVIAHDLQKRSRFIVSYGTIHDFAVHPFQNVIAITRNNQEVVLINTNTMERTTIASGGDSHIEYHPSGDFFLTTTNFQDDLQPTLTIWDAHLLEPVWQITFDTRIGDAAFSPDGLYLAVAIGNSVLLWNISETR